MLLKYSTARGQVLGSPGLVPLRMRLVSYFTENSLVNWLWWPSGLERVSNSSRHSLENRVRIPAQDYNIDCSEVEILCPYSNSRAPVDMCRLQYQTERDAMVPENWY